MQKKNKNDELSIEQEIDNYELVVNNLNKDIDETKAQYLHYGCFV